MLYMCFTPIVSLSIAIFEAIVAIIVFFHFKKNLSGLFIFLLGFYQFTEFMLCSYGSEWARIGFITYTFLPALGLHIVMNFSKRKTNLYVLYILPVLFSVLALTESFVSQSSCGAFFVRVQTMLTSTILTLPTVIYILYYFGFIAFASYLLLNKINSRNKAEKLSSLVLLAAVVLSLVPPVILFIIFPSLKIGFPSIYCDFALLFAICVFILIYIEKKIKVRHLFS